MIVGNKGPVINYRGGGGWWKTRGVRYFCARKKGGSNIFVQYKYLPRMTLLYHKTYR